MQTTSLYNWIYILNKLLSTHKQFLVNIGKSFVKSVTINHCLIYDPCFCFTVFCHTTTNYKPDNQLCCCKHDSLPAPPHYHITQLFCIDNHELFQPNTPLFTGIIHCLYLGHATCTQAPTLLIRLSLAGKISDNKTVITVLPCSSAFLLMCSSTGGLP